VDQGHSRSFWKVQGHAEHIEEKSNFNISSYNRQSRDLQKHIQSVAGNVYNTLDMAPGVNPTPQKWEIG
jgi:hypothetical protein